MNFEEIIGNQILFLLSKLGVCECVRSDDLFVAIEIVTAWAGNATGGRFDLKIRPRLRRL
jgi:hypothetical protein